MSTSPESLISPIRVFFTGLLAVSYNLTKSHDIEVGIQHGVGTQPGIDVHKLRITILERAPSGHRTVETRAPHAGLPAYIDCSQRLHWRLHVKKNPEAISVDNTQDMIVFDGPGWHPGVLPKEGAFNSSFRINTGRIYAAIVHGGLVRTKRETSARAIPELFVTPPAVSIAVNVDFNSANPASLYSESEEIFKFVPPFEYDVYVSCVPDYTGKKAEESTSDFQLHYKAFDLLSTEWYDVKPDPTLPPEKVGLNFAHPCIPIYLGETNI